MRPRREGGAAVDGVRDEAGEREDADGAEAVFWIHAGSHFAGKPPRWRDAVAKVGWPCAGEDAVYRISV